MISLVLKLFDCLLVLIRGFGTPRAALLQRLRQELCADDYLLPLQSVKHSLVRVGSLWTCDLDQVVEVMSRRKQLSRMLHLLVAFCCAFRIHVETARPIINLHMPCPALYLAKTLNLSNRK